MSAMGSSSTFSTDPINQDAVVFENVADQYIKGEDVHIEFTILNQQKINVKADRIGLIRVGANAPKDCLIDVPIASDPSGTFHRGQATFPASSLTMTDDEFYQFCYINDQGKILALSIPFQLNCSPDDVDLLSSCSTFISTNFHPRQGLITLADHDQDDLLVVHTKGMILEEKLRQENRQLLEQNRRLEELHQQIQVKLDLNDAKFNDYIAKTKNEMQILANTHKTTIDELTARQRVEEKLRAEFEASMELCHQYQSESLRFAERCRALEDAHTELTGEVQRLRAQLSLSNQSIDEQTIQIVELEKSLINSTEALKKADQYQNQLEQQLKDLGATAEKYQKNVQGKLDAFAKQASQQENQIHALESANELLKDELKKVNEEKVFLLNMLEEEKHEKKILQERCRIIQMYQEQAEKEVENMRKEFEESQTREEDNQKLVTAMTEIQKRCVKHQKSEIDAKRQLSAERELVTELKGKIHELTERLTVGAEEYKALYRKYLALQRTVLKNSSTNSKQSPTTLSNETGLNEEALVSLLRNSYELQQQQQNASANQCRAEADASTTDRTAEEEDEEEEEEKTEPITSHQEQEVQECPICYWEFPNHLTLDNKKDHIDGHFD